MVVLEFTIRKKRGEDTSGDIRNIIATKLNNDRVFIELLQEGIQIQGISDTGKPYVLLANDDGAIVVIRKDDKNVLVSFIKTNIGISEIDSILRSRYAIYAFRGRTRPYERQIKSHILELLAEEEQSEEPEAPEIPEIAEPAEKKDKGEKKEKKDKEREEPEEVYEEIFRTGGNQD